MKNEEEFLRKAIESADRIIISKRDRVLPPSIPDYKFMCDPIEKKCKMRDYCFLYQNGCDLVSYTNGMPCVAEDRSFGIVGGDYCPVFKKDPFRRWQNSCKGDILKNIYMVDCWTEETYQEHKLDLINLYYVDYE